MTSHFLWASRTTPLHKQGQELRSEQTVTPLHEQHILYYIFCDDETGARLQQALIRKAKEGVKVRR